jgi:hypothetical protein
MNTLISADQLMGLPGEELVRKGLADLGSGKVTEEACLVSMASPRLRDCGLLSADASLVADAELTLYRLLGEHAEDPYSSYNSLVRRLVSFEHALDNVLVA